MNIPRTCLGCLTVFCASAKQAFAQGCATCYTTAAAGGPQTAHALRSGILVLLIPPVLMFAGIILLLRGWGAFDLGGCEDPAIRIHPVPHDERAN